MVWLTGGIKSPPFSAAARYEAGMLLRLLQEGLSFGMPHSRPLPSVGSRCHELRVKDVGHEWRIVYRIDPTRIVVVAVFDKKGKPMQQREFKKATEAIAKFDRDTAKPS